MSRRSEKIILSSHFSVIGVVQRFEYTVEAAWKYLTVLLEENDGIDDLLSPKRVIQEALKYGYIDSIE